MPSLTSEQKRIIAEAARLQLARDNYADYINYVHFGNWVAAKHHQLICDKLQDIAEGRLKRLMIFMPPRHGKSMAVTETFPSYFVGRNPGKRVIEVSYGDSLAQRFGKLNRQKIAEFGKQLFGVSLSRDKASMTDWDIDGTRGGMLSVGVGGGITGQGADLLLIDDPIKNREEAESEVYRERVWGEWGNTLLTRLHPGAAVIIILTRWHEDDLAGRLLAQERDKWDVLSLPCEAEDNDLLGRQPGDPLWPEHGYDHEWMEQQKKAVGSQAWAALYQQRPSPAEGALIKRHWWRYYDVVPNRFDQVLQSWDLAFKDSDGSDYVAGTVWGRVGANKYLLDLHRERMDLPATMAAIQAMSNKWPNTQLKLVEDKANGPAVIQMLQHKLPGMVAVKPEGSKVARVQAVLPHIEAGNVYLPNQAHWVGDFVEECSAFPRGKHDDMVDSMSQALIRLIADYSTYKESPDKDYSPEGKIRRHLQQIGKPRKAVFL